MAPTTPRSHPDQPFLPLASAEESEGAPPITLKGTWHCGGIVQTSVKKTAPHWVLQLNQSELLESSLRPEPRLLLSSCQDEFC